MGCCESIEAASGTKNPVAADGNDGLVTEAAKDEAEATMGDVVDEQMEKSGGIGEERGKEEGEIRRKAEKGR